MFKKFWLFTGLGDLKSHVIEANLKSWEKESIVVKAAVFTKHELFSFYTSTSDLLSAENLLLAVFAIIGTNCTSRLAELFELDFADIKECITDGKPAYKGNVLSI